MRIFLTAVTAALAVVVGLVIDATTVEAAPITEAGCPVFTTNQQHQQTLAHLDQLAKSGAKLTPYARLVQAGLAVRSTGSLTSHLMAYTPRTYAYAPPVNEDPGGGGGYPYAIPSDGFYLSGVYFPHGLKIYMGCPGGGSAWTGAPPGDLQAGIAVHTDSGISNQQFAYCPATAWGNCLFDWEASDVPGTGLAFFWITGKNTYPIWYPGWSTCR